MIDQATSEGTKTLRQEGLVSVIIIFLDEERFLRHAIDSVLAQDYPEWELLLVDDGSSDASAEIARSIAASHPRVRYLKHPGGENRGMSASRNLGLRHAQGEYVAFLDADDAYLPARLRRHVEILQQHPHIAMTVSDHIRWFSEDDATGEVPYARPFFVAGDQLWKPPLGLAVVMGVPFLALGICNITVRRDIALQVGGFDDSFRSMYEDQVFTSKMLARHPVYMLQAYLALYRHHAASWTRKLKAAGEFHDGIVHADTSRFVAWLLAHLEQQGIDDPMLLEMVRSRRLGDQGQPGPVDKLRMRMTAAAKRWLAQLLPAKWHRRLLLLDYERDRRRAQRAYWQLAQKLGRRALERARPGDDS